MGAKDTVKFNLVEFNKLSNMGSLNQSVIDMIEDQAEISFKAGIREVAEWIPKLIEKIKNNMWEDDWGIKGVLYEDMLDSLVKKLVKEQLKEWGL